MALYHTTKGSVDYTVVGSPTIVDGVVSGFNGYPNPACLSLPETADFSKPFHIHIEFTPTVTNFGVIIGRTGSLKSGVYLQGIYSDYCRFALYNSSSTPAILDQNIAYDSAVVTGNKHALDIIYNGTDTYSIKLKNMISSVVLVNSSITTEAGAGSNAGFTLGATKSDTYYVPFQGSIDLNNTYIKVNGQPWFGLCPVEVKKHQLMGPVGYTVVGSPTINNGVMTNSDPSNYISIRHWEQYKPFEFAMKINTGTRPADTCWLVRSNGLLLYWKWDARLTFFLRDINNVQQGISGTTQLENNKDYWIKIIYDGTMASMYLSTDSQNYSLEVSQAISVITNDYSINIGSLRNTYPFTGSIDLNQTYIKVNGKLWFWQPQKSKYIVKDGKLVFADPGLYLTGPVNYEVVGNPTIVDGVASGFSASDYLQCQELTIQAGVPYEIATAIITPSDDTPNGNTNTCGIIGANASHNGLLYTFSNHPNPGCINFYGWQDNSGSVNNATLFQLEHSTLYYVKYGYDGDKLAYVSVSQDKINWETKTRNYIPSSDTQVFYIGALRFFNSYFPGSIDLNETYIKVNDQLWFYGKNYATQNIAPVPSGYTFGNTTTPSIGYVDMRTQQFTAAPQGATIGRDE